MHSGRIYSRLQTLYHGLRSVSRIAIVSGILIFTVSIVIIESFLSLKSGEVRTGDRLETITFASGLRARLEREVNELVNLSNGMSSYLSVRYNSLDTAEIQAILKNIHNNSGSVRNLGIAIGTKIKFLYPIEDNEKVYGMDYRDLPDQWPDIERIISSRTPALIGPVKLVQGGKGFIYRYPIILHGKYWGLISTVIDSGNLFQDAFRDLTDDNYAFAIRSKNNAGAYTLAYGDPTIFSNKKSVIFKANLYGARWEYGVINIHPSEGMQLIRSIRIISWTGAIFLGF